MTVRFDHAGIETTEIDADVAFYTGALGMRVLRWGTHIATGKRIAMLSDGHDAKIELMEVAAQTGELAHIAFRTDDVAAAVETAVADGAVVATPLVRIEAALAETSVVRIPTGTRVQFIHYEPGSPDLP